MTHVLVIDDDLACLKLTEKILSEAGYAVHLACDGEDGLRCFNEFQPPIVISDVKMPKLGGIEVLKRIKGIKADTVVVMMTGHGSEAIAAEAIQWGASNYLRKPFTPGDMIMTLYRYRDTVRRDELRHISRCFILREHVEMDLATDLEQVEAAIQHLADRVGMFVADPEEHMTLRFGIAEMLTNALEHGNLAINYQQKKEAFDTESWEELLQERLQDAQLSGRRIQVIFAISRGGMMCSIKDEGSGFDWTVTPDPFDPVNMHRDYGRGIFMTRNYFDEVCYSEGGRKVTLSKRFAP